MEPMSPTRSRRDFLRLAGGAVLSSSVASVVAGCSTNNTSGSQRSTSGSQSSTAEDQARAERILSNDIREHFGSVGESFYKAKVTNPTYVNRLATEADGFRAVGKQFPLKLDESNAIDTGGWWTNQLQMTAPTAPEEEQRLIDLVSANTGEEISSAIGALSYRRYLDIGTSERYGSPLLGNYSVLFILPNVNTTPPTLAGPTDSPTLVTPTPSPSPRPDKIYLVTPSGFDTIAMDPHTTRDVADFVPPRGSMTTSFLDSLVGLDAAKREQYTPFDESAVANQPDMAVAVLPSEDVVFTEANTTGEPTETPPTDQASGTADSITSAPTIPEQQRVAGESAFLRSSGQALGGDYPTVVFGPPQQVPTRWGDPGLMPPAYGGTCGNSATPDGCQSCCATVLSIAFSAFSAGLWACIENAAIIGAALSWFFGIGAIAGGIIIAGCWATWAALCAAAYLLYQSAKDLCLQQSMKVI